MNDMNPTTYRVSVGHAAVQVSATSEKAAIAAGRRKLCEELPRMWDVISDLDDSRFQIEPVEDDTDGRNVA